MASKTVSFFLCATLGKISGIAGYQKYKEPAANGHWTKGPKLTLALVLLLASGRLPGDVVVVGQTVLAVVAHGVVGAVALAVHHASDPCVLRPLRQATLGVTVAGAGASDGHVVDGVVVLFLQQGVTRIRK